MGGVPNPCGLCNGAGSSGVQWLQVVDQPGDSVARWTDEWNNFESAGGVIQNVDVEDFDQVLFLPDVEISPLCVFEAEVRWTAVDAASHYLGLLFTKEDDDLTTDQFGVRPLWIWQRDPGGWQYNVASTVTQSLVVEGVVPVANAWHTWRILRIGDSYRWWVDGVLVGGAVTIESWRDNRRIGLVTRFTVDAQFRNIRAWNASDRWWNLPS